MKNFYISEMLLLSRKEQKAKKVSFDKKRTVIFGGNGTGKSSLIKSIYRAFGAEVTLHSEFKKAECVTLVRFFIDQEGYSIIRDGNQYGLFDGENVLLGSYGSVTKGLGPKLAELFDFRLKLKTKSKGTETDDANLIVPPPAFLLLPYYVDQDKSWGASWKGFERLEQFSTYQSDLIDYHVGITTNEYYDLKEELLQWQDRLKETNTEHEFTQKISNDIRSRLNTAEFNIDIDVFKAEIATLLTECGNLKKKEDSIKSDLMELFGTKAHLEEQLDIVRKAAIESSKDYKYVCEKIEDSVDCPVCGANYENTFSERFSIAMDENRENELLIELKKELGEVNEKIDKIKSDIEDVRNESGEIRMILNQKKETVELHDVLKSYGKNEIKKILSEKIGELDTSLGEFGSKERELKADMRELKERNKERVDKIKSEYLHCLRSYFLKLDISLSDEDIKNIHILVEKKESGSARPRALIAYYFAFFQLMKKYGSSTYCPIVIDSPNQQAQDLGHIHTIFNFIKENQPADTQLILGLEEFYGIDFECSVIELKTKRSLLDEGEFTEVNDILTPLLKQVWL